MSKTHLTIATENSSKKKKKGVGEEREVQHKHNVNGGGGCLSLSLSFFPFRILPDRLLPLWDLYPHTSLDTGPQFFCLIQRTRHSVHHQRLKEGRKKYLLDSKTWTCTCLIPSLVHSSPSKITILPLCHHLTCQKSLPPPRVNNVFRKKILIKIKKGRNCKQWKVVHSLGDRKASSVADTDLLHHTAEPGHSPGDWLSWTCGLSLHLKAVKQSISQSINQSINNYSTNQPMHPSVSLFVIHHTIV